MKTIFAEKAWLPSGWLEKVRIAIGEDGLIDSIYPNTNLNEGDERVSVLIPAMPNLHSHAFQRAMAGLAEYRGNESDSFWSWRETMYTFARTIDVSAFQAIAAQVYGEMLAVGYSAVAEFHYLHHLGANSVESDPLLASQALLDAARATGIGMTLCPVLYLNGGFGEQPLKAEQRRFQLSINRYCDLLEKLKTDLEKNLHQRLGIAFHSLRAVPPEALKEVLCFWKKLCPSGPVHMHISEQMEEVEACKAWSGKRPLRWLLDEVEVDDTWCLVHGTHLDQDEIRDLAASGATAGLCPTTEANLGDGFFDMLRYREAGGYWGIGSDSHISISPVEELRWLEYGQRLRHQKRNLIANPDQPHVGAQLWQEALLGGQRALGGLSAGLVPGSRADLLVLDTDHPLLFGREEASLIDTWIFAGNQPLIKQVMAGGVWVVNDGRHYQEGAIAKSYRQALPGLLQPQGKDLL